MKMENKSMKSTRLEIKLEEEKNMKLLRNMLEDMAMLLPLQV